MTEKIALLPSRIIVAHLVGDFSRKRIVGENHMPDGLEWRERLERAHKQMQEAMTELITNKNYSEAERLLHFVDKLMLDLIEDMGGSVVRSGLWT
jgi:hypothetical protein